MDSTDLLHQLKKYFGFSKFKGLQQGVVESLLSGKNTFAIMPTGGGKSLCYQLPALIQDGTAIIVSPLIALMKNQVDAIRGISSEEGIAHVLNSSLTKSQTERVKSDIESGVTKLLYVAPESLTKPTNIAFFKSVTISFLAIDEAHCISEWGHDFRPDYRSLRIIIEQIQTNIPIIALTATATPKVQEDIIKNLQIGDAKVFKDSFNRPNLYYEVRSKTENVDTDIIKFIKENSEKSGIVYCLSRKRVEELAQILQVNGFNALPYHAGLDSKTRVRNQDMFLNESCDVIVATIAFGMGIDKPDVRFVIHHDIPKSIESYYQETGRAGRDGGEGHCLAFYNYRDIEKLEKFMSGKPVAEQEIGMALLQEMVAYAETSISRRKFILHYFGEAFDEKTGEGCDMDDNVRFPKPKVEARDELIQLLEIIRDTHQKYKSKEIVNVLIGKTNSQIISYKTHEKPFFGRGQAQSDKFWMALLRQAIVAGYISKKIENYGILFLSYEGEVFLEKPSSFLMSKDHDHEKNILQSKSFRANGAIDTELMRLLKSLRKEIAHKNNLPPFAVFQEYSLEDMALKYPIRMEELININGVGEGKAKRFGSPFIELIDRYTQENDITRPEDLIVKSTGINSSLKLYLIQSVDRKLPLEDIAAAKGMNMDRLITEMETIVFAGTKLDINYWIEELLDEDQEEELYDYFMEAESDKIQEALESFDGDFEEEEIRLYRIKFISEVAN